MNYLSEHKCLTLNPKELLQILNVVKPSMIEKSFTKELLNPPTAKLDVILFFDRPTSNVEADAYTAELKEVLNQLGIVDPQSLVIHF